MRRFEYEQVHQTFPHCSSRVLAIGLDGATYDVLMPLAESGVMPNVRTVLRGSALAQLNSTEPYTTPVAWTSFQTGCDVETHGIFDYRYLDHVRAQVLLNHAGRIACPTLFDEVCSAGGEVVSINLPMTYSSAGGQGIIIGGLDSPSAEAALAGHPQFAERLRAAGVDYHLNTIWKRKPESYAELSAGVAKTIAAFRSRAKAAEMADELSDWRLMVVQFQTLDSLQHRCWHLLGVDPAADDRRLSLRESSVLSRSERRHGWVAETQRALRALDDCVGELLELAARRDAAVVLLSDHGFGPFREKIHVNELLARRGLLRLASPAQRLAYRGSRAGYKLRRWRRRRLHGGSTASLRRPLSALAPIDWRRTIGFAVHGELAGLVYLNAAQRFGRGPVRTPRQLETAEAEVIAAFCEARHPETDERLFGDVYGTRGRFDCDPIERGWPDVVAIPSPGFHTRTKFDHPGELLSDDPTLVGTHRREGVLLVASPAASAGEGHAAEMRDVAPTILHLLGQSPGEAMTGTPLTGMVGHSTTPAPTHRLAATASSAEPEPVLSHHEQAVVEQRLRELGYLE